MASLYIDNYIITTPLINILYDLRATLTNGKLRDIKARSSDIVVTCPHHSNGAEATPDCNIYIGDNDDIPYGFARCFACEFQGSFEVFVAECFDSSIDYAKKWLITNYGEITYNKINIGDFIKLNKTPKKKYLDGSILDTYDDWCPYLQQRGLSREVCSQFKVKYDPVHKQVVFPVYDENDNLLMMPKRSIESKVFYLDSDCEKPVYCLGYIKKNNIKSVIATEGMFDALSSWTAGIPAIAFFGKISDTQINSVLKSGIKVIYTAFDNDKAGRSFEELIKRKCSKRILVVPLRFPQQYKDLGELPHEILKKCYEEAKK